GGGLLEALCEQRGEAPKARAAVGRYVRGSTVGRKELAFRVFVEWHQCRKSARPARVPREGAVFGPRQLKPDLRFTQQKQQDKGVQYVKHEGGGVHEKSFRRSGARHVIAVE